MSDSFLDEAKHSVLVENTGQTVLKNLRALEDKRSLVLARWIWELLQNARDAAESAEVTASVTVQSGLLRFAHDGRPFRVKEVAHLVYHGSTKQQDPDAIGQYGTGFLSTHLINPNVRVQGLLEQGRRPFDFVLSREGSSASDLSEAMDRSWKEFERSLGQAERPAAPETTVFEYALTDAGTVDVVSTGIKSLEACAPYVLALNHRLRSLVIKRDNATRIFAREGGADSAGVVYVTDTDNGKSETLAVAFSSSAQGEVSALLRRAGQQLNVVDATRTPRLFLAFPLIGTEDFPFPAVINSQSFSPNEERDGVPLGTGDTAANANNKTLIESAADGILALIARGIEERWGSLSLLSLFPPLVSKDWINSNWLAEQQQGLVRRVLEERIVRTQAGANVSPTDAWIPVGETANAVWRLTASIAGSRDRLPESDSGEAWARCVQSWSHALNLGLEETAGSWTLQKLADWVAEVDTLAALRERLVPETDAVAWLNELLEIIVGHNETSLLDEFALLLNQDEELQFRSKVKRDPGIDAELKAICRLLGAPVTGGLLHPAVPSRLFEELLEGDSQDRVLSHALARLKERSGGEATPEYVNANVGLFSWLLAKRMFDTLDGYPALTADGEASAALNRDAEVDDRPLAPVALWPPYLQPFAHLFPRRKVLNGLYAERSSDPATWVLVANEAGLLASPVYGVDGFVDRFLPDDPLPSENTQTHESTSSQQRFRIAYLTGEIGVLNGARKSIPKATSLLEMIIAILSNEQNGQLEPVLTECDCGQAHHYFPADWITPLHDGKWIPLGAGRADSPNADSIAALVHQVSNSAGLLQNPAFSMLVGAFRISLADVTLRSLTTSEQQRASLVQAFTGIVEATGGNAAVVGALAEELQNNPLFLEQLEDGRRTRARVAANKALGDAVERALKARLESLGLTVTRTGVGSDYEIESDILENGEETWFRVESRDASLLLEVKATRTDSVRMTRRQGETAVAEQHRFALCVIELDGDQVTEDVVAAARFVVDVGRKIAPVERELLELEEIQSAATLSSGGIEVVMTDSQVRFRISAGIWRQALGLEFFVTHVANLLRPSSVG